MSVIFRFTDGQMHVFVTPPTFPPPPPAPLSILRFHLECTELLPVWPLRNVTVCQYSCAVVLLRDYHDKQNVVVFVYLKHVGKYSYCLLKP